MAAFWQQKISKDYVNKRECSDAAGINLRAKETVGKCYKQ